MAQSHKHVSAATRCRLRGWRRYGRSVRVVVALVVFAVAGAAAAASADVAVLYDDYGPAWAPGGDLIAFERVSRRGDPFLDGTWIVRPDGTEPRRVARSREFSWAPAGDRLVVGAGPLRVVDTNGRVLRRLTTGTFDANPAWSPRGAVVAFRRGGDVWVVPAMGGKERRVARGKPARGATVASQRLTWAPDGRRVAFVTRRGNRLRGDDQIHVVDLRTGARRVVGDSTANEHDPVWSHDGGLIAFSRTRGGDESDVYVIDARGGVARNVSRRRGYDAEPAWSPRSAALAYTLEGPRRGLVVTAVATGELRVVTDAIDAHHAAWAPDGAAVAVMSYASCRVIGIHTLALEDGRSRRLTNPC